jgi:nucleotide-binding universal stress UspA family protein
MYKHIMLPIEGDEQLSSNAVNECFSLAKSIGAKVTVMHVVPHTSINVPVGFTRDIVKNLKRQHEDEDVKTSEAMLSEIEEKARCAGVECDKVVVVGDNPYEEIVDNALKQDCDLIMMASHARRGLDAMLFGSETARVIRHTKLPVLVVH